VSYQPVARSMITRVGIVGRDRWNAGRVKLLASFAMSVRDGVSTVHAAGQGADRAGLYVHSKRGDKPFLAITARGAQPVESSRK